MKKEMSGVYEKFGMAESAKRRNCGVLEWIKCNVLRWFGHVEIMQDRKFTRRVYDSTIKGG